MIKQVIYFGIDDLESMLKHVVGFNGKNITEARKERKKQMDADERKKEAERSLIEDAIIEE